MTNKEIEKYKSKLKEIVNIPDSRKKKNIPNTDETYDTGQYKRFLALRQLALDVGASHISPKPQKTANEGELVYGIHMALQTETMVNTSKSATKSCWVAITVALVAFISAIAAWAAIIVPIILKAKGQ